MEHGFGITFTRSYQKQVNCLRSMTSSTIYRHPDLCLQHGAILCPTAAPVIRPLKPFLPSLPLLRLGIGEREPARALVGAGAAADTRLLAGEHETPQPEAGQERTTRESQHEARLPRASVSRPTVERRCSVMERRDEQDGLREWRRLVSRCYHIFHCKPKSTHGNRPRIETVGLQGGGEALLSTREVSGKLPVKTTVTRPSASCASPNERPK